MPIETRVLAIESSMRQASVMLLVDHQVIGCEMIATPQSTAAQMAPAIDRLLRAAEWSPDDIQLVAVCEGPGSFTGLRVGLTTAKTWAYATACNVVAINTLSILAQQVAPAANVSAVMDAQRGQFFTADFQWDAQTEQYRTQRAPCVTDVEPWLQGLSPGTTVVGPALEKHSIELDAALIRASADQCMPKVETLGKLALAAYRRGERTDLWKLVPIYLRPSAAEEKLGRSK